LATILLQESSRLPDSAASASWTITRSDYSVTFSGFLHDRSARELIAGLESPGVRRLVITSRGGDENAALDIADVVDRRQLQVQVRQVCASACANSILVAGHSRVLESDSFIGLHGSSVTLEQNYLATGRPVPPRIERGAARLRRLYEHRHADAKLLECAAIQIGLTQQYLQATLPGETEVRSAWRSRYHMWIPSTDTLARYRVSVTPLGSSPRPPAIAARLQARRASDIVVGRHDDCSPP
jgi:hypothetical protein